MGHLTGRGVKTRGRLWINSGSLAIESAEALGRRRQMSDPPDATRMGSGLMLEESLLKHRR